jgi:hypothetical protein
MGWEVLMQQYGARPATEGSAITALVLGIAGIFVLPLILSIPAVVVGKKAQKKIDASGGALGGAELAKAGVICGWIGTALGIVFLLAIIVIAVASVGSMEDEILNGMPAALSLARS